MYKRKVSTSWPIDLFEVFTTLPEEGKEFLNDLLSPEAVNIASNEKGYKIYLLAPGRDKQDFKIELEKDTLSISAEGRSKEEGISWIKKEFGIGAFKKKFTLKESVDPKNIIAKYENGILEISLAKKEEKEIKSQILVA